MQGETERRTGVDTLVHEDSSTVSTQQFSTAVGFRKRSIDHTNQTNDTSPHLRASDFTDKTQDAFTLPSRLSGILMLCVLAMSSILLLYNQLGPHYNGNNYFPPDAASYGLILLLILGGLFLQYGRTHITYTLFKEIIYFYGVMASIALFTNAIQLTPFEPIDPFILMIESKFPIQITTLMAWLHQHPTLKMILTWAYISLDYQIAFIPLAMIIFSQNIQSIRGFYCLMLLTTLIGFSIYYFFPTTAPASLLTSPYFSTANHATGLKFHQIHHYLPITTNDGGLIALPSFHAIWAVCCLYLVYEHKWIFIPMLALNSLLIAACALLGWHYFIDLIGAGIVLIAAYAILRKITRIRIEIP